MQSPHFSVTPLPLRMALDLVTHAFRRRYTESLLDEGASTSGGERKPVRTIHSTLPCAALAFLFAHSRAGHAAHAPLPAAQPAATQPATQPTTRPGAPADPKAQAGDHRKNVDPRWRQIHESMRNSSRRWADAPIVQTMSLDALIRFTLSNGTLRAEASELATVAPMHVAVKGSKAVWMLARNQGVVVNAAGARGFSSFTRLDRYDLDAGDEDFWSSHLVIGENFMTFTAQNMFANTSLIQNATGITVRVTEFGQWGQQQKAICAEQAKSLQQLRADHPEVFRLYVAPVLARFSDMTFLMPGPADVYSVFVEIPADQTIIQSIAQLLPQLDADDPDDREAGSAKLRQMGIPAVLAALRWDETDLSEEQKARLESFVDTFRRRCGLIRRPPRRCGLPD